MHKTNFDTHERVTERFHQYRNALVPLHKMKIQAYERVIVPLHLPLHKHNLGRKLARRRLKILGSLKVICTSEMYFRGEISPPQAENFWSFQVLYTSEMHFQ